MDKRYFGNQLDHTTQQPLRRTLVPMGNLMNQVKIQSSKFKSKYLKCISLFAFLLLTFDFVLAQQATWIWYPGDYEIWLSNKMQNRRTERGSFFPPFWKLDSHYPLMDFHKVFDVKSPETIELFVEGKYNVKLDGKPLEGTPTKVTIPAGKHKINIKVFNQQYVPAIYLKGKSIVSDSSWLVTYEDKEWIDETGKVSDQSGTTWLKAGYWNFDKPTARPSQVQLPVRAQRAVKTTKKGNALLADFGKETFGFIKLHGLKGKGNLTIYYGESQEEALSTTHGETLDRLQVNRPSKRDSVMELSKAFRYVNIIADPAVTYDSVSMLYEYAPVTVRGDFRCSDDLINKIYDVSKYTFELNTREFFIDGIKRDRWIWSGDAYQSYLMNYYLYFDNPTVERTLVALRGKDPVTSHINTIMDYTFYWFIGIYDYYLYTGDTKFIQQYYPRMQSLMEYVLSRRNKNGMVEGLSGDWVFIDWAEGLSKKGEVSFEQLLFARSLEAMAISANIAGDATNGAKYQQLATDLKSKIFSTYWNEGKQALVHSRIDGVPTDHVTRYANMFAIFFNWLNDAQKQGVKQNVLLNKDVPKITTPYMRFYELEALAAMGEQAYVLKEMKDYWGGMLNLGATSFWEEYNPSKQGVEHLAMYGRPFGKSLCHAWGASPIYLLGKYYLGVKPTAPGYETYVIEPSLGGLQWMEGKVPTPHGQVTMYVSTNNIKVKSDGGIGTLRLKSASMPVVEGAQVRSKGDGVYEVTIEKGKEYSINYKSI
ncbi:alpha-L-rhamnosidase C-terminal domain-containing protein [Aridibaculum aurantiacum]|uniref:alpha-L-rhamnosidase-related protein n=1 Tax=Aridibaculum aurantiacum TaxID=2810307 RepID=UPI001F605F76|nr:alpha-L-rhamnosidase C-terminal domain-containing protein [Aridibaculum aurantiacum]